jgi:hypothetical protein
VTDANDPPVFRLGSKVLRYIPEDAVANQKLLGDPVVAIDEDANDNDGVGLDVHYTKDIVASPGWTYFSIDSKTGVLSINGQTPGADFDYETLGDNGNNTYELVVIATDEAGATGKVTVTVELNDVNEPPVVQPGLVRYITEVSPRGALVGAPIPAEDKDLGGGQRLRFSMGLQKNAPTDADKNIMSRHFGITEHGQLFVKVGYESLEFSTKKNDFLSQDDEFDITVCATDSGFPPPNKQPGATGCEDVKIIVLEANEAPAMERSPIRTVNENCKIGTSVGAAIPAKDPEGDAITF